MNSSFLRFFFLIAVSISIPGSALAARGIDQYLPENPQAGWNMFTAKHCIRCHSVQGVGGRTGPDLGDIWLGSFVEIASSLWNHFPRMKEAFQEEKLDWPTLTEEEGKNLITFIYFLNYFDKTANAEIGEKLFHEKNCSRCHSVGGKGGDIGPNLDGFQNKYAAPYITAQLWNKGPKMMRVMRENRVPRPIFQERDVIDILAFIREKGFDPRAQRRYLPLANPAKGKALFQRKNCGKCHSVRGQGGTIGPDLAKKHLKGSLSQILSQMWNHGANMWPRMTREGVKFPRFSAQEMSNLISYLYFLDFAGEPGSAQRGKQVFADKECALCHLPDEPGGDTIGPDLGKAGLDNSFKVLTEMWNHAPAIEEMMKEENIRWPILKTNEMRDLIAYILSVSE